MGDYFINVKGRIPVTRVMQETRTAIVKCFDEEVGVGLSHDSFDGKKILEILDFSKGLNELPKSDVLKYLLEDNSSVVM